MVMVNGGPGCLSDSLTPVWIDVPLELDFFLFILPLQIRHT